MKHTKEEIINALKVIEDVCRECITCDVCPLGKENDVCRLDENIPACWDVAYNPPETWRALK